MLVKCNCNNCPAHLEFDSSSAGAVVVCPKCGLETTLFVPTVKKAAPPQGLPIPAPAPPEPNLAVPAQPAMSLPKPTAPDKPPAAWKTAPWWYWGTWVVMAVLVIAGLLLILAGCRGELSESARANGSAIRQTVYAIQYCNGFILLGLGAILELLIVIARK
jgi:hypothetical protein